MMMPTLIVVLIFFAFMGRLIAAAVERSRTGIAPHYEAEIARLRGEVDELNAHVARLSDEQQFMMKLLSSGERRTELPPDPRNEETA